MLSAKEAKAAISKPICSYCGNEVPVILKTVTFCKPEETYYQVSCDACGAQGPRLRDQDKAIAVTQWALELPPAQRKICMKLVVDNVVRNP
jgi:hypothetical protein